MAETKDIIKDIVDQLGVDVIVKESKFKKGRAIVTLDCTYWLMELDTYEIDGLEYQVEKIEGKVVTFDPIGHKTAITVDSFTLNPPPFFHGTYRMTKQEINSINNKQTVSPMIWLREVREDNFRKDPESMIDRDSTIELYFVASADYENWLYADHFDKVIYPLNTLVREFFKIVDKSKFFTDIFNYRKRNLVNISVGGQQIESIFDLNLSGIEIRLFAEIRKDLVCDPQNLC